MLAAGRGGRASLPSARCSPARLDLTNAAIPALTVEQPVSLSSNSALTLNDGVTLNVLNASGFDLEVQSGATLTLNDTSALNADTLRVNGGTLNTNIDLSYPTGAEFELSGGGALNILNSKTFSVGVFDPTNIKSGVVNVAPGSHLSITSDSATIGNGVTLNKDGVFGAADQIGALTVQSGGVVTHTLAWQAGVVLDGAGGLDVRAGGAVGPAAEGRAGGDNGGPVGVAGEGLR